MKRQSKLSKPSSPRNIKDKPILKKDNVTIRGNEYTKIVYQDGEIELIDYDAKAKMWVHQFFAKEKCPNLLEEYKELIVNTL